MTKTQYRISLCVFAAGFFAGYGSTVLTSPACAAEPPGIKLTIHPAGYGTLLELGVGNYKAADLAAYFEAHGRQPGATIRGKGRSLTVLEGPIAFRGAFPELTNVTIRCEGNIEKFAAFDGPGNAKMRACLLFENPVTATTENVTVRSNVVGLRTVVHTTNFDGAPVCDWKTPDRGGTFPNRDDNRTRLWRDSKSEHRYLEVHTTGGGGLLFYEGLTGADLSRWRQKCPSGGDGSFSNHVRLIGGHTWDGTGWKWHRCRLGLIDDANCPTWREHLAPNPAIEMHGYTLELSAHHIDAMPHLGVLVFKKNQRGKFNIEGAGSYLEPVVNWRRAPDWHPSGVPPWIIGGDAVGRPVWDDFKGGPMRADNFKASAWPTYIFGPDDGDPLFQKTATW